MNYVKWVLAGAACSMVLWIGAGRAQAADEAKPEPGKQQAQTLERTVKITMKYLLYLPKDYAQQEAWPLLLFLHGAGERGDELEKVKVHGPPKLIAAGKDLPFIVVSPQCPSNQWWQPHALAALIDEIVEKIKQVDLEGLSNSITHSAKAAEDLLAGPRTQKVLANLESVSVNLDQTMARVEKITAEGNLEGIVEVVVFPEAYRENRDALASEGPIFLVGRVDACWFTVKEDNLAARALHQVGERPQTYGGPALPSRSAQY